METKKGQSSIEFLTLVIFAMILFALFYGEVLKKNNEVLINKIDAEGSLIVDKVANEINIAITQGDGYSKDFSLPEKIYSYDYNITTSSNMVFVEWIRNEKQDSKSSRIIIENVTGLFKAGTNTIRNVYGVVYAN